MSEKGPWVPGFMSESFAWARLFLLGDLELELRWGGHRLEHGFSDDVVLEQRVLAATEGGEMVLRGNAGTVLKPSEVLDRHVGCLLGRGSDVSVRVPEDGARAADAYDGVWSAG